MKRYGFLISLFVVIIMASCQETSTGNMVVLNEVCGKDNDGLEWVEIGNASADSVNIKGYKLLKMDVEGIEKKLYVFPDMTLAPGAIYTVNAEDLRARIPHKKAVIIELINADGDMVDCFDSTEDLDTDHHPAGGSYARIPNITGDWTVVDNATWGLPNE